MKTPSYICSPYIFIMLLKTLTDGKFIWPAWQKTVPQHGPTKDSDHYVQPASLTGSLITRKRKKWIPDNPEKN